MAQEYVNNIVELLKKVEIDKVGVRFFINSITWESNSKELPSQDYVYLWDAQGITDMSSFGKKNYEGVRRKIQFKSYYRNPRLN